MPELPEVETICRGLQQKIIDKKIKSVQVLKPNLIKTQVEEFSDLLSGRIIDKIDRVGKLLILRVKDRYLLIHLKMTGQLIYRDKSKEYIAGGHPFPPVEVNNLINKSTAVVFEFVDGTSLVMNDQRLFGYLKLVSEKELNTIIARFGVEPLQPAFTRQAFREIFQKRRTCLKAVLLNQKMIAGIGNIYADEICFCAGVRPQRKVNYLSAIELDNLYDCCRSVISRAIAAKGTTFRNYRDTEGKAGYYVDELKVYGQAGKKCKQCGTAVIQKIKLVGRGTHFCPICQK